MMHRKGSEGGRGTKWRQGAREVGWQGWKGGWTQGGREARREGGRDGKRDESREREV